MVERAIELRRRYGRKKKMAKLKAKLGAAAGEERERILFKIHRLSPWWKAPETDASAAEDSAKKAKKA